HQSASRWDSFAPRCSGYLNHYRSRLAIESECECIVDGRREIGGMSNIKNAFHQGRCNSRLIDALKRERAACRSRDKIEHRCRIVARLSQCGKCEGKSRTRNGREYSWFS